MGPNGEIRLFRPNKNMERLARSAARVALPVSFPLSNFMGVCGLSCICVYAAIQRRRAPYVD